MAQTLYLRKLYDSFVPTDLASREAMEGLSMNGEFKCTLTQPRNIKFHRKLFALIGIAFDAFDIGEITHKGIVIQKNMDRFRKDLTIQAGFYETVYNLEGDLRLEAKSISFASMSDDEFAILYNKFIDVWIMTNCIKSFCFHKEGDFCFWKVPP